jgi:hypothetical protein
MCPNGADSITVADEAAATADRWVAIVAGRNTWQDSARGVTAVTRTLGGLQSLTIVLSATVLLARQRAGMDAGVWGIGHTAPMILVLVSAASCVGPSLTMFGRTSVSRSLRFNLAIRTLFGIGITIGVYGVARGWASMFSWPIGVAMGCDAALTSCAIGWRPSPWQWWTSFIVSPIHLGIIGGLVGKSIGDASTSTLRTALPIYVTTHVWVAVACITAWLSRRVLDMESDSLVAAQSETARDGHRRSAHWLHDDICAQLRLITLKVQTGDMATHELVAMLDEVDFALRLRQLDELLESGVVRLAELLQPFLRNAQNHGVDVERVPTYETASTVVNRHTGIDFRRAAAILTSNALNAGATRLSIDIAVEPDQIQLSVTDDAGGFEPSHATAGRGLWSLRQDLGDQNLRIERLNNGSKVTATVPTGLRRTDDQSLAR